MGLYLREGGGGGSYKQQYSIFLDEFCKLASYMYVMMAVLFSNVANCNLFFLIRDNS